MSARHPLTGRDYKRGKRGAGLGIEPRRLREFGIGLGIGLLVAGVVFVADHRVPEPVPTAQRPTPRAANADDAGVNGSTGTTAATAGTSSSDPSGEGKYDFYQMLPKFEVVVPEKEHGTRVAPAAKIDKPGVYFLQAGSYRDETVADRIRAQLGKLGIDASVQRVAVDTDVWHRVRIGPIRDLNQLNKLRAQLQAADLDSLVVRVDD